MSGKRAKQIRRTVGISTQAKRDQRQFERDLAVGREIIAAARRERRRRNRAVLALFALGALATLFLAGALR